MLARIRAPEVETETMVELLRRSGQSVEDSPPMSQRTTQAPRPVQDLSLAGLRETGCAFLSHPPTMFVVLLEAVPALYLIA
jgi:hypothetical protein